MLNHLHLEVHQDAPTAEPLTATRAITTDDAAEEGLQFKAVHF
jgi:hypothetical protein